MTLLRLPFSESPLPHVLAPLSDESLLGYLFRLDAVNDWEPGTVATMICTHRTSWKRASAAMWASGTIFDLRRLASLVEQPYEAISALIYLPDLRAATGDPELSVHALGDPTQLAFCPACLAETGTVLRRSLLPLMLGCPHHRVRLMRYCFDHSPILPRVEPSGQISCAVCHRDLGSAQGEPLVGEELAHQLDTWRAWAFLLGWRGDDIRGRGHRTIKSVDRHYPLRNLGPAVSFERLVTVFLALQIEPSLVVELEDRPARPCPNATCPRFSPPGRNDRLSRGRQVERHCSTCGARFVGRRLLLCFDADHGGDRPSARSVRRAQRRLRRWREDLVEACRQDVLAGRRITITGTFRRAGVPLNANLRANRLGLVDLVRDAARRQRIIEGGEPAASVATTMAEYRLLRDLLRAGELELASVAARLGEVVPNRPISPVTHDVFDRRRLPIQGVLDSLFSPRWTARQSVDPEAFRRAVAHHSGAQSEGSRALSDHWRKRVEPRTWDEQFGPVVPSGSYPYKSYPEKLEPSARDFVLGEWSPDWMPGFFESNEIGAPAASPFG